MCGGAGGASRVCTNTCMCYLDEKINSFTFLLLLSQAPEEGKSSEISLRLSTIARCCGNMEQSDKCLKWATSTHFRRS